MKKQALIVTSIAEPNAVLRTLAKGSIDHETDYIVIGDVASPPDFEIDGCSFFNLEQQLATGFQTAKSCLKKHYARKNVGYLVAIRNGAEIIIETDDDNMPLDSFWEERKKTKKIKVLEKEGWVNIYKYFTDSNIWPRGLPLNYVNVEIPAIIKLKDQEISCPIQQGLADENPDVDAIYRLILPLPQSFNNSEEIGTGPGTWCPFNSQNTTWFKEAFPLMYLPSHCPFRMTDIWRSFVAQRIAWENNWPVLFHPSTVVQDRNDHNLMRDFEDEIPGYLQNENIGKILSNLELKSGVENIPGSMRLCYESLAKEGILKEEELPILEAWLNDINSL